MRFFATLFVCCCYPAIVIAQTCGLSQIITPTDRFECGSGTTFSSCTSFQAGANEVRDSRTRLIWQRCPLGMSYNTSSGCTGVASTLTWANALAAGTGEWHLPNVTELLSIVESGCYDPAINLTVFPATVSSYYWSSSPNATNAANAWFASFFYGGNSTAIKTNGYYVRLVRVGP